MKTCKVISSIKTGSPNDNDTNVIKTWNNKTNLAQLRAFSLCKGLSVNNSSDQAFIGLSNLFKEILIKFFKVCIKPPLQKMFIENNCIKKNKFRDGFLGNTTSKSLFV